MPGVFLALMYFLPVLRGASYHSQNGQYCGCVPHKPSGRFTVAHPGQGCTPSSPLVPGQVPFFEVSSRSGNTEPCGRFSVETETQAGRMDVEPSDWYPRFGICLAKRRWTSLLLKSHPSALLWFSLSFPTTLGIDAFAHSWPNVSLY